MVSQVISPKIRFLSEEFKELPAGPLEWKKAYIEVITPFKHWESVRICLQDTRLEVLPKEDPETQVRLITAEWPRSGPGRYKLSVFGHDLEEHKDITIRPFKISEESYHHMLESLEVTLPASIALSLQKAGGLEGFKLVDDRESTLEEQMIRLRRVVNGPAPQPGLSGLLSKISNNPHSILTNDELWAKKEKARRPLAYRLVQSLTRNNNIGSDLLPVKIIDSRPKHHYDVYENRLLKSFVTQVESKLRRLVALSNEREEKVEHENASDLLASITSSKYTASFLDEVADAPNTSNHLTMFLMNDPNYRAMLDRYLEFKRYFAFTVDDPDLDEPLEKFPELYQKWATMEVIKEFINVGRNLEFEIVTQRLFERQPGDFHVKVLSDGKPAIKMKNPKTNVSISLTPERTFSRAGDFQSVSFTQKPDVVITIERPESPAVMLLFDPKYKLDGEDIDGEQPKDRSSTENKSVKPKKVDIDKMHAYRDAIRDRNRQRIVSYAAILYPGPTVSFVEDAGIQALRAVPGDESELRENIQQVFKKFF